MPGAEMLLDQTKHSSWLISHDLSTWWCYWRRFGSGCLFNCSAMWLIILTIRGHLNSFWLFYGEPKKLNLKETDSPPMMYLSHLVKRGLLSI